VITTNSRNNSFHYLKLHKYCTTCGWTAEICTEVSLWETRWRQRGPQDGILPQ